MQYRVVFTGQLKADVELDAAAQRLAQILKTEPSIARQLLSGGTKIVKKGVDLPMGQQWVAAFAKAGAVCSLEPEPAAPPPLPSAPAPAPAAVPQPAAPERTRRADEQFCRACGAVIPLNSLACPYCGKRQKTDPGGCMTRGVVLAAVGFMMIPIMGILAAIAIPNFLAYRNRGYEAVVKTEMRHLVEAEHAYWSTNGTFTADVNQLDYRPSDEHVRIEIESADEECFTATGRHIGAGQVEVSADCTGLQEAP